MLTTLYVSASRKRIRFRTPAGSAEARPMGAGAGAECAPGRHSGYAS